MSSNAKQESKENQKDNEISTTKIMKDDEIVNLSATSNTNKMQSPEKEELKVDSKMSIESFETPKIKTKDDVK